MGKSPCCETGGNWIALPHKAGLKRCGKSCRLRWLNYLRPNIKHGEFSDDEDRINICTHYASIRSRIQVSRLQVSAILIVFATLVCLGGITGKTLPAGPGAVAFTVEGRSDPYTANFHFTKVKLGSPPREFYMQIDTSSNMMSVNCNPCVGCPPTSGLGIELGFFDPSKSSTSAVISCSDARCDTSCNSNSQCSFSINMDQKSQNSGYFISDEMHFEMLSSSRSKTVSSSANVVFGCSTYHSGYATEPYKAIDGVFGLGPHRKSVVSQLAAHGSTPNAFAHCLKGGDMGGGSLVLGEVVDPRMAYTPLVPFQPFYSLNLLSISVSGRVVPIDPVVFRTSTDRGTIVDSGATSSYLSEEAYSPFITAVVAAMPPSVISSLVAGAQCFQVSPGSTARDVFPLVSLNFDGGASMILTYEDYLMRHFEVALGVWCMGFVSNRGPTILGENVLKDKVIVYDLDRQRLGWVDFNCSLSMNVSTPLISSSPRSAAAAATGFVIYVAITLSFHILYK